MGIASFLIGLVGWLLLAMAVAGIGYTLAATAVLRRFFASAKPVPPSDQPVTLLKPLHGAEPRLAENLSTFLDQDHRGPVQVVCGVADEGDGAVPVARALGDTATLVIDPVRHGASGKISNIVNLMREARHDILVLSDSDMAASRDYLSGVTAALREPGVGAVTLAYRGRGDTGFWSTLGAAGLSWQFLPGVVFGVRYGLAHPCMGSTIALRRETLERIGGFKRFADTLADDHAIGAAVRELGLSVAVPPLLVTHACTEQTFGELWRHEVRWGATTRSVGAVAYAASVIAMPFPLALLGALLAPAHGIGGAVAIAALAARALMVRASDHVTRMKTASHWLLPVRDVLTFAVYGASLVAGSVHWRGSRFRMREDGQMTFESEIRA